MSDSVIDLTCDLVRFPSISPTQKEATAENVDACSGALDRLQEYAKESGGIYYRLPFEGGDKQYPQRVDNLLVEWDRTQGKEPEFVVVFMGHIDVVQAGEGWTTDPFQAVVANGYIQGRGVLDMKASVAAFFDAVDLQVHSYPASRFKAYAIITSDEEWAAVNGSIKVLEYMAERRILGSNTMFLVGEPSGKERFGDTLAKGRPGSWNMWAKIIGVSGHTAYTEAFINPCDLVLAHLILALKGIPFKPNAEGVVSTNLEITSIIMGAKPSTSIIQPDITVNFNIRFSGNHSFPELKKLVVDAVASVVGNGATFDVGFSDYPSNAYQSEEGPFLDLIQNVLTDECGSPAKLINIGGTSDARHVHKFFPRAPVYELGPPVGGVPPSHPDYGKAGGMHMRDERVAVQDVITMRDVYAQILNKSACKPGF